MSHPPISTLFAFVLALVAGCTASGHAASRTASLSVVAAPSGFLPPTASRLRTPEHLAIADVDLAVPSAVQVPTLSFDQAYAECATEGSCVRDSAPTMVLVLVTTPNSGSNNTDGSVRPLLNRMLAYVLTWTKIRCLPAGGDVGATPRPQNCTFYDFIDAATGKFVYGADGAT